MAVYNEGAICVLKDKVELEYYEMTLDADRLTNDQWRVLNDKTKAINQSYCNYLNKKAVHDADYKAYQKLIIRFEMARGDDIECNLKMLNQHCNDKEVEHAYAEYSGARKHHGDLLVSMLKIMADIRSTLAVVVVHPDSISIGVPI
jgi:hypothetical protein